MLIVFDLDGTLFKTDTVDVKAINTVLKQNNFRSKSKKEIIRLFGYKCNYIVEKLTGSVDEELTVKMEEEIKIYEKKYINTNGRLYKGVHKMLNELKNNKHQLLVCSNGSQEYITLILKKFNLENYFCEIVCSKYYKSKIEAVSMIKEKYKCATFIMVGDRIMDVSAAHINGGLSVGALYGYGKMEIAEADFLINKPYELVSIIEAIQQTTGAT